MTEPISLPNPNEVVKSTQPAKDPKTGLWHYTYTYRDGTVITYEGPGVPEGPRHILGVPLGPQPDPSGGSWTIVDSTVDAEVRKVYEADVKQALALQKEARAEEKPLLVQGADGRTYLVDPNTRKAAPLEGMPSRSPTEAPIYREGANGQLVRIDPTTNTAAPVTGMPAAPPKILTVGRRVYRENPDGTLEKIDEVPQDLPQRAPRTPEEIALDQARLAQINRSMLPEALVALDNHFKTLEWLRQQAATGKMTLPEAEQYMATSRQNLEAALQGTTLFQQQQAEQARKLQMAQLGQSLLNQRLSSGTSLANALLAAATSIAGNPNFMAQPGQTFSMPNALDYGQAGVNQLGGGPQVGDQARAMLMGATQAPAIASPAPAAPLTAAQMNAAMLARGAQPRGPIVPPAPGTAPAPPSTGGGSPLAGLAPSATPADGLPVYQNVPFSPAAAIPSRGG